MDQRRACRRWLFQTWSLAAAAATVLLVNGCGGPSPEERFVERVCATTLPRVEELLEIMEDVRHTRAGPGGPEAVAELLGPIERSKAITRTLSDELRAISAPDTEAGSSAESYLQGAAASAFGRLVNEERQVRRLPERITLLQSIRGLDSVELALFEAYAFVVGAEGGIRMRIPELGEHFDEADSCKELDAVATD